MNLKSLKYGLMHGLVIMNFAGAPRVQLKNEENKIKIKNSLSLKSDTNIQTDPNEYIVLKINDRYQVTVLPDSIFTADGKVDQNEFTVRSIAILKGQIYIQDVPNMSLSSSDKTEVDLFEPLKIESDFFSFLTEKNQKLSLLIDLNLKNASLKVCNFSSDFKLKLFDHEIDQNLKPNEGVRFQGVLDKSGHVIYDILLEKRKVPQGKWAAKEICSQDQIKKIEDQVIQFRLKSMKDLEKSRLQKIAEKKRNDVLFLCHKPDSQLDQCHFILRQNKCIRERCNAEGKWADQTEISSIKNRCSIKGEVKDCGY